MAKTHNKKGRPSRDPSEEMGRWHEDLDQFKMVLGESWVVENLPKLQNARGRKHLRKLAQELRNEVKKLENILSERLSSRAAFRCGTKWIKHKKDTQKEEAEAIDLLVDAFEHSHPQKAANFVLTPLLQEAKKFKAKEPRGWKARFQSGLHLLNLGKHNQPHADGIVLFATDPKGKHPDYSKMTFEQAVIKFIKHLTGFTISRMSFFRVMKQIGLSTRK